MTALYRLLGLTAGLSARMGRLRINGIPTNVLILCVLGLFLVIGSDLQLRHGRSYGKLPRQLTVAEVLSGGARRHDFVTVVGPLDPRAGLLHGREGAMSDQDVLIPMVDPRTNRALLVERAKNAPARPQGSPPGAEVAITGMLRSVRSDDGVTRLRVVLANST